ncbi:hypothetical protein [Haladaptatus cibarius]|uniref:hypothetical protein n=1 Tax=Haladaptatus cibarius TaxID=453847 RepID=UPI000678D7FF|nr:hypothetical protein [Haladaptatus cibarius]
MNKLAQAGEGRWHLPQHAHIIVYEAEKGDELLTIYDCGAAQKPPSAQVIGNLVRVRAEHELDRTVTGYIVKMRERSVLVEQDADHFVITPV